MVTTYTVVTGKFGQFLCLKFEDCAHNTKMKLITSSLTKSWNTVTHWWLKINKNAKVTVFNSKVKTLYH